jgi:hypothetical protein
MRYPQFLIFSLCIGALSQALAADQPPVFGQSPAAATPSIATDAKTESPAAATAETQAKADAEAKAKAVAEAKAKAVDKRLRAQGYKPINSNGTVRYCRNEQELGSRFQTAVCGTPEELDMAAQIGKSATETMQRVNGSQRICQTGGVC